MIVRPAFLRSPSRRRRSRRRGDRDPTLGVRRAAPPRLDVSAEPDRDLPRCGAGPRGPILKHPPRRGRRGCQGVPRRHRVSPKRSIRQGLPIMVATSLPFWMHHTGRSMMPFLADQPVRAERGPRRGPVAACRSRPARSWWRLARRWRPTSMSKPGRTSRPGRSSPTSSWSLASRCRRRFTSPLRASDVPALLGTASDKEPPLIGLLAFEDAGSVLAPFAAAWHRPQWVTSAPLLDRIKGAVALDAMLGWLASNRRHRGGFCCAASRPTGR